MPKVRTLEPEFWDDKVIDSLPRDERLLAAALITLLADDEGRFIAEPSVVKKRVFGVDDDISIDAVGRMLNHVAATWRNCRLYAVDGQVYGILLKFPEKQGIRYIVRSKLPPYNKSLEINDCGTFPKNSADSPRVELSRVGLKETTSPRRRSRADKVFSEESPEMKASRYIFGKIRTNNSKAKEPNWQGWAREFDLIFRVDGRSRDDVRQVIDFSQKDTFWHSVILSPRNLRKKFDQLLVKSHSPPPGSGPRAISAAPMTDD